MSSLQRTSIHINKAQDQQLEYLEQQSKDEQISTTPSTVL